MANKTLQLKIGNTTYRSSVDNTLTNEDLNNVKLPGLYNAGGSNSVTNKPSGVDHFGLLVIHRASGAYYIQIIYNDTKSFRRFCVNGTWGNWTEDKLTDTTYTSLKNPCALTLKINSGGGTAYDGSSPITYDITKTALGMNKVDNTADVDKSVKHAKTADTATTATTLGSATIGSDSCGVYWHNGKPVKMNATVGNQTTPIYFLNGTATACSLTKASVGLSVVDNTMDSKKTVDRANKLKLLANRPESLNFDLTTDQYRSNITYNIATSSTKVGKCPADGHVLTFGWDTTAGYGSQMAITDGPSPKVYVRGANSKDNKCVWDTAWKTLAFTSDIPTTFAWDKITGKPSSYTPASHEHDLSAMINKLSVGTSDPTDADYYVCQYAGGGTSTTSYHRRPVSALWNYIKSKASGVYAAKSHTHDSISMSALGRSFIGDGAGDTSNGVGGAINNIKISSWNGVSFTTSCTNQKYTNKTAVGIDCRNGIISADTVKANAVYNAVYNDYAEFFPRGEATEPGDIVALDLTSDHESYIKATTTSKIVAGVHSDEYAMLIGGDKVDDGSYVEKNLVNFIPVSLAGRVMCKVTGPVHRGDTIIVSDIPGVGIATDDENIPHKRVVGYVVEDDDRTDIRRVKIRVKG